MVMRCTPTTASNFEVGFKINCWTGKLISGVSRIWVVSVSAWSALEGTNMQSRTNAHLVIITRSDSSSSSNCRGRTRLNLAQVDHPNLIPYGE